MAALIVSILGDEVPKVESSSMQRKSCFECFVRGVLLYERMRRNVLVHLVTVDFLTNYMIVHATQELTSIFVVHMSSCVSYCDCCQSP